MSFLLSFVLTKPNLISVEKKEQKTRKTADVEKVKVVWKAADVEKVKVV